MKKILIVDDHPDIRRLIRITLGKNYEIFEAEDGLSALYVTRKQHPDLVILDVMMPGEVDGFNVLKQIKKDPALAAVKVVMVTARGQAKDYDLGMNAGADAYFVKPFSPVKLATMVRTLVEADPVALTSGLPRQA